MELLFEIKGGDFIKGGHASSQLKKNLQMLNLPPALIKRSIIALYEAEMNVVAHAFEGNIKVEIDGSKIFIQIVDKGPGIADIDLAMQEGYSTASKKVREMGFGAGMGLPNIKKNADKLDIKSIIGEGTTVEIYIYL